MGFGDFVGGFQQGFSFVQDARSKRQRQRAIDYTLAQMGREEAAAQANSQDVSAEEREFYGDNVTPAYMPEFGTDPFLFRLIDTVKRKFGARRRAAVPGAAAAPAAAAPAAGPLVGGDAAQAFAYPEYADGGVVEGDATLSRAPVALPSASNGVVTAIPAGGPQPYQPLTGAVQTRGFRDGGPVDDEEARKTKERAAKNRARTRGRVASSTKTVEGADRTQPKRQAIRTPKGAQSKPGLLKRVGAGGAALAGIGGAVQGFNTPTEDYYTRLGLDPSEVGLSFWKDLGVRTVGVMSDVGASALGMLGVDQRSRFADQQAQQLQPQQAAGGPRTAIPTAAASGPAAVTASAQRRAVSRTPTATPPAEQSPQLGDAIDLSNLELEDFELPDLKTEDWKRYRAQALRTARLRGLPQAQALDEVDKLVTGMQIRGFSNYASQALALMQANNMKGATRALRAAYQYFPDGNDVKFAVHNGRIVAVAVDEETGQPFEGGVRVITPEFLAGAIQNFQNPTAFLSWTKDWRDEQFKRQRYKEVEKPLAEAQGQALRTNAEANVARAEAAELRASMARRGGGLRPSDMARSEQVYRQRLELLGITDPAQADQLAAVMSQIKQANPQVPDNMIVDFVMKAQARPDGAQFIQRALSGQ